MKKLFLLIFFSLVLINYSFAAVPVTFVNGTTADATEVNSNFNYFENKFSTTSGHDHDGSDSKTVTTLGTITSGTWQGSILAANYGGTGISEYATGDIVYATADSATTLVRRARGTLGSLLVASHLNSEPDWLAPGTSGYFLRSGGSGSNPNWDSGVQVGTALAATDQTTTSASYVDLPSATVTITTGANPVLIMFSGQFRNTNVGALMQVGIAIDGTVKYKVRSNEFVAAYNQVMALAYIETVTAGSHTFKIQWFTDAGTATASDEGRIIVIELK